MNKNDYIKAVDNITAPGELLKKIEALDTPAKKKKTPVWKILTAAAACFVAVTFAFSGIVGGSMKAGSEADMALPNEEGYYGGPLADSADDYENVKNNSATGEKTDRKIVKTASISIKTKNYDVLVSGIRQNIEFYGGYIEQSQEYNYDSASNRYANMKVKIPADKLEVFIEELAEMGTITSKSIESSDITDSYIDVESRINALETEEKTLLSILEKAESLSDVIELQERLSAVRSDLEGMKAKKQSYDGMVAYSGISLDINEVERVVEGDDSFFGEVKEKLMNNVYDLVDFFRELLINVLAALPYIAIIGVAAVIVVVIVKKKRKR